jgi:VIT1/CCC1 family predicted Fe2+/Mn2+ transporter
MNRDSNLGQKDENRLGFEQKSSDFRILTAQKNEITECHIYKRLATVMKKEREREILQHLARDEKRHYEMWKGITGKDVKPDRFKIYLYYVMARLLGLSFSLRLMEKGEGLAQVTYSDMQRDYPQVIELIKDEQQHEGKLLGMINEKSLVYIGSVVLGLSDAIVELTGALAGLTLALQETRLIALVGFITGFAASLSMGASEYLSTKEEGENNGKHPLRSGIVTGTTYVITVFMLISTYFIFSNPFVALGAALVLALIIISAFTFYTSVAKGLSFKKRFFEMAIISLSVAAINFVIGLIINSYFNI